MRTVLRIIQSAALLGALGTIFIISTSDSPSELVMVLLVMFGVIILLTSKIVSLQEAKKNACQQIGQPADRQADAATGHEALPARGPAKEFRSKSARKRALASDHGPRSGGKEESSSPSWFGLWFLLLFLALAYLCYVNVTS